MSIRLADVDVSISGTFTLNTQNIQLAQVAWIEFLNESPYTLEVACGGLNIPVPAWTDFPLQVQVKSNGYWNPVPGAQFPVTITPKLLVSGASDSTMLLTTLYAPGETPATTVPQPLVRQAFIPNTVNTAGGDVATSIQNDNKAPLTTIIESTPSDAVASTWHADNSGNLVVKGDNAGTLTTLFELIAGLTPLVRVMGLIQMDQTGHIIMPNNVTLRWIDSNGNSQAVLVSTAIDEVHLRAVKSGGNVVIADSNDSAIGTFAAATGLTLASGGLNLTVGSISKINIFNQAVTTVLTAYNHGLGVQPKAVIMQLLGTTTTAATGKYDDTSMTTTQVKMISSVAATYRIIAIA